MDHNPEKDLVRIKELMQRTGEFIAYFELAETKMMEWRQDIEQQAARVQLQTQTLYNELASVHHLLSQTGASDFRVTAEKALSQGEAHLKNLECSCKQFALMFQQQQEQFNTLTTQSIEKIEAHATQTLQSIVSQLSKYDVHQFHRIASESCDHVERVAHDAVTKSNKLLHAFQLRFSLFAVLTTVLTTFVIVLYLSDEYPWEMHHQAMNERQAGKVLLQAWPNLTQIEKTKILHHEAAQDG